MNLDELIAARPACRSDLGGWYAQLFEKADEEELSLRALASRLGCTATNLYRHRQNLRSAAASGLQLVRATIAQASPSDCPLIEVRVGKGRIIAVPPGFDPATLRAVLEVAAQC